MDFSKLRELVAAVKEKFSFAPHLLIGICSADALNNTLLTKQCPSYLHMTMMILLMLRSLGLEVRLVYSMQPVPVKDTKAKVVSATKRKTATKSKMKVEEENESEYEVDEPKAKSKAKRVTRKRARSDSDEVVTIKIFSKPMIFAKEYFRNKLIWKFLGWSLPGHILMNQHGFICDNFCRKRK